MDSINADVPHPQFHLTLGSSTTCHCCFYSKTEGLQSVGDLETMYILTEKNPKSWQEILSQKQEFTLILWLLPLPCYKLC